MQQELGLIIKRIRLEKELTLQDLSKLTDLSVSYFSLLERGMTSPTIAHLQIICQALSITMSSLINQTEQDKLLITEDEREIIFENEGVVYESLTSGQRNITGVCMTISSAEPHVSDLHIADEVGVIIEGSASITINDVVHELRTGDTIYIPAYSKHSFQKTSRKDCVSYWFYRASAQNESDSYPIARPVMAKKPLQVKAI